jgi:hypothetical protein
MHWRLVILFTIIIFWLALIRLLTKWPRSRTKSISQHSASVREAYLFFTTAQLVCGISLYLFMVYWFIPALHLSLAFTIIYTITTLLQLISALIPDKIIGRKSLIHQALAYAMADGMFIISILLSFSKTVRGFSKTFIIIVALYMAYCMILFIIKKGRTDAVRNYLLLQSLYIVLFQFAILVITFAK